MLRLRSIMMASLALLLVLTACTAAPVAPAASTGETAAAPAAADAGDDVTTITWLTLTWNGVEDVIAVFEAENPDMVCVVGYSHLTMSIQMRSGVTGSKQPWRQAAIKENS